MKNTRIVLFTAYKGYVLLITENTPKNYTLDERYLHDSHLWIHNGEVKKNHTEFDSLYVGRILSKKEIENLFF
jgi:hypothetical protein